MQKGQAGWKRFERANRPPSGEPWIWLTREMVESPAWRALSKPGMRFLSRVMLEHMMHGGTENGRLICTYDQCEEFGISRKHVWGAIENVVLCGFVDVVDRGQRAFGIARRPSTYALTWLPRIDGTAPTNRWKHFSPVPKRELIPDPKRALDGCPKGNWETPNSHEIPSSQTGTTLNISTGQTKARASAPEGSAVAKPARLLRPKEPKKACSEKFGAIAETTMPSIVPDYADLPEQVPEFLRRARC
jgi:hypothetical protein